MEIVTERNGLRCPARNGGVLGCRCCIYTGGGPSKLCDAQRRLYERDQREYWRMRNAEEEARPGT